MNMCEDCGALKDESPDSTLNEIRAAGIHIPWTELEFAQTLEEHNKNIAHTRARISGTPGITRINPRMEQNGIKTARSENGQFHDDTRKSAPPGKTAKVRPVQKNGETDERALARHHQVPSALLLEGQEPGRNSATQEKAVGNMN